MNEKEKLKKQKEKEKLKKQKEKLKKQKQKEKLKYINGGVATTRNEKKRITDILNTWEREDDPDDWFQMWREAG